MAQSSILSKYQKYPKVPRSKTWSFNVLWHHLKTHTHTPLLALHPPNQKTPCLPAILRSETPGREYLEAALRSPSFVRVAAVLMPWSCARFPLLQADVIRFDVIWHTLGCPVWQMGFLDCKLKESQGKGEKMEEKMRWFFEFLYME